MHKLVAAQPHIDESKIRGNGSFTSHLNHLFERANTEIGLGTDALVVLPEDIGFLPILAVHSELIEYDNSRYLDLLTHQMLLNRTPLSMDTETVADALARYIWRHPLQLGWRKVVYRTSWTQSFFLSHQALLAETYFNLFSELARKYSSTIVAGSGAFTGEVLAEYAPRDVPGASLPRSKDIYNAGAVFGPSGKVLGLYSKVNLVDIEKTGGLGLTPSSLEHVDPIPTPFGTIAPVICIDIFDEEVVQQFANRGADILVQPGAIAGQWDEAQQLKWMNGLPKAVEKYSFSAGVNSMLTGDILDVQWRGQSSIVTANESTTDSEPNYGYTHQPDHHIFSRVAGPPDDADVISATVSYSKNISSSPRISQ